MKFGKESIILYIGELPLKFYRSDCLKRIHTVWLSSIKQKVKLKMGEVTFWSLVYEYDGFTGELSFNI